MKFKCNLVTLLKETILKKPILTHRVNFSVKTSFVICTTCVSPEGYHGLNVHKPTYDTKQLRITKIINQIHSMSSIIGIINKQQALLSTQHTLLEKWLPCCISSFTICLGCGKKKWKLLWIELQARVWPSFTLVGKAFPAFKSEAFCLVCSHLCYIIALTATHVPNPLSPWPRPGYDFLVWPWLIVMDLLGDHWSAAGSEPFFWTWFWPWFSWFNILACKAAALSVFVPPSFPAPIPL